MDDKQQFQLLADAATAVQVRRLTRTNSGLYLVLACGPLLVAAFRMRSPSGLGWLLCGVGLAFAGLYGVIVKNPESVLPLQVGVAAAVAAHSAYRAFRGAEGIGIVFALIAVRLAFVAGARLRSYRIVASVPAQSQELVRTAFIKGSRSDPATTPELVALRRSSSLWSVLTRRAEDYDYRLLFDQDLVFLIGTKSFLGLRYSPRIRLVLPSRSFHVDVVGESLTGRRTRVRLMLDTDPVSDALEITPEMLEKVRQQAPRLAMRQ
jgi:hypothetical protein